MTELAAEAHAMAVQAIKDVARLEQKQDGHEDICSLRYEQIKTTMDEIKDNQKTMFGRHIAVMVFVIGLLLAILGGGATYVLTNTDSRIDHLENGE